MWPLFGYDEVFSDTLFGLIRVLYMADAICLNIHSDHPHTVVCVGAREQHFGIFWMRSPVFVMRCFFGVGGRHRNLSTGSSISGYDGGIIRMTVSYLCADTTTLSLQ
jgi:hypothetical protein